MPSLRRIALCLALPSALAACAAEPVWAPDEAVARAHYVTNEPPSLTLYTMIRTAAGEGLHSGLLVNADEQVMFDPAGTWYHPLAPERNDVHFGMTPKMLEFYVDYHARESFHVVEQKIYVTPEVAAQAKAAIQAYGAVPKSMCAISTSAILASLPGFENTPQTWFPARLMRAFGETPGVIETEHFDDDSDNNAEKLLTQLQTSP